MTEICVIKIETKHLFTPGKDYFLRYGKRTIKLICLRPSTEGWIFQAEEKLEEIKKYFEPEGFLNGKLTSEDANTIDTLLLEIKPLTPTHGLIKTKDNETC